MPKRLKLLWTGPARFDLVEAHAYIAAHNRTAAAKYAGKIRQAVRDLLLFPEMGSNLTGLPLEGHFRSIVVRNHRIVYRLDPDRIIVYRVWDCRQDPDGLWEALEEVEEEEPER